MRVIMSRLSYLNPCLSAPPNFLNFYRGKFLFCSKFCQLSLDCSKMSCSPTTPGSLDQRGTSNSRVGNNIFIPSTKRTSDLWTMWNPLDIHSQLYLLFYLLLTCSAFLRALCSSWWYTRFLLKYRKKITGKDIEFLQGGANAGLISLTLLSSPDRLYHPRRTPLHDQPGRSQKLWVGKYFQSIHNQRKL